MDTNELACASRVESVLGEGPLWHRGEQALYWVDIEGRRVHRLRPVSGEHDQFDIGWRVGALAFRKGGGLLLAAENKIALWDMQKHSLEVVAQVEIDRSIGRFNDGRVDPFGRFWVGTLGGGFINDLYRLDTDFSVHPLEHGVGTSNGIGWSPDQQTMYYTDSARGRIYAYDFDAQQGSLANRRIFVQVAGQDGVPDGLCVDSEGFVWSAHWDGWRISRYDPQGRIERVILLPVQRPTSCTFGGKKLDELYITSARINLGEAELKNQPLAGCLLCLEVNDVTGMPEAEFLG